MFSFLRRYKACWGWWFFNICWLHHPHVFCGSCFLFWSRTCHYVFSPLLAHVMHVALNSEQSLWHMCFAFFWPCLLFWHGFQAWLQAHVFSFKCFASNSFFWLMLFGHVLFADVGLVQSKSAGRARLNVDTYCAWHCFVASKLSGTPTSHFSHSSCCMWPMLCF